MEFRKPKALTAMGRARSWCGLWLLAWGALLGGCQDSVGTALYVTIDLPSSMTVDQLRISGAVAEQEIGPQFLPEQPERLLTSGETFRVLLPAAADKSEAELYVEGLHESTRVALGASQVRIREGSEVDVTVRLEPSTEGFCPNCPDGCCVSGVCTASTFNTCGTGGIACQRCDRNTADACAAEGFCACGRGAACDPLTTDNCRNGQCRCGIGAPCGFGQQCVSGRCECTPGSCSGCCVGNACEPGNERDRCGRNAEACISCGNRTTCLPDRTCG